MKKVSFALLILLVIITASCSITAGIPWIWGGWGFFADFGVNFASSQEAEAPNGFLTFEKTNGVDLRGTLEFAGENFEVDGKYLGNGEIVLDLFQDGVLFKTLRGSAEPGTMAGSNWHAVKAE